MPPKPKFTKEEITKAALDIVKEEGVAALTARVLGSRFGTSARPIFTTFKNMDEVKWATRELAMREFEEYAGDFESYSPAFKRVGMLMIEYAIHEPELYKLLFMQSHVDGQSFEDTMCDLGSLVTTCIELLQRDYAVSKDEANLIFEQVWVHTFGLGTLCAMKLCDFTQDEISDRLGIIFLGALTMVKSGKTKGFVKPQKNIP